MSDRTPPSPTLVAAVLVAVGAVPWSVQTFVGGEVFLRFVWGGVSFEPAVTVQPLVSYPLVSGPPILLRWAGATACWLGAVVSAATNQVGLEDPRVTTGLLALAGFLNLLVALEFGVQPTRTGYPTGTAAVWLAAGWRYARADPARRRLV
ncbi:TIGR04206 family protein [Halobaculum sp. MBLA0143]|uniref:TIGR04206 family protein n=1 Tax=Halobaculum sp. MBLA0143 TaxID=3079933 RepID=UPI00352543F3